MYVIVPGHRKQAVLPDFMLQPPSQCEAVYLMYLKRSGEENGFSAEAPVMTVSSFSGQGCRNLARAQAQTVLLNSLSTIFIEKKLKDKPN